MDWMPVPALGGVNLFDDPRAIRDEEVQLARNLVPSRPGIIKKRGGLSRPHATYNVFPGTEVPVAAAVSPIPGSSIDVVVVTVEPDQSIVRMQGVSSDNSTLWSVNAQTWWAPRPYLLFWNGRAYLYPGPYAAWGGPSKFPMYVMAYTPDPAYTGSVTVTGAAFAGAGNENMFPAVAAPYKTRLALANFGKGYENTIVFTDDYTADVVGNDVLASNSRAISLVAGADGDEIVAMIEVMLTNVGSPAEAGLLILRRYGDPFLLTGDQDQTTGGDSTLDIKRISVKCGCAGPYTVARTPVGIIWTGADDVWCFAAGVLPHRLGQKIQPALKLTPAQLQYRWSAAYFDGFYRLAIWGAGQPMTLADPPGDQWWLDLRTGLPEDWREAKWWGPQQVLGGATIASPTPSPGIWMTFPETRAGKESRLFYVDQLGTDIGWTLGEYGDGVRDLTADTSQIADSDYVDPEVTAELITKEYALSPARDQINDGVMAVLRPSNDLTVNVDFVLDDGDNVSTRTKYLAGPDQFRLDSSHLDTSGNTVNGRAIKTALYPQVRRAAQTHRFRIYDTSGYTIITGVNDQLVVGIMDESVTPAPSGVYYQWVATVPQGNYTLATLLTALQTAINTGRLFGDAWTLSLNAGVVRFATLLASNISIYIVFESVDGPPSTTAATTAQLASSRRLGAILGLNTDNDTLASLSDVSVNIDGSSAPFKKGISDWEIYGVAVNMEVLPRTP